MVDFGEFELVLGGDVDILLLLVLVGGINTPGASADRSSVVGVLEGHVFVCHCLDRTIRLLGVDH